MRVLHVGKYYPPAPGGMEKVVQLLCERERAWIDSRVLAANTAPRTVRESYRGVPVTRVASVSAIGSVAVCPTFPIELARISRDVTVLHEPNPQALVSDCLMLQRGPLVVWFHSEVLRPQWKYRLLYRPFLRKVLARASRIVVSSPRLAEYAAELQPFRDRCVVIPFGIRTADLTLTPVAAGRVAGLQTRARPTVLFVGRLVPYKGVRVLLDAIASEDVDAWIVGTGPLRGELEAHSRALGITDRVHFFGQVDDEMLVGLYHACDMFVLPSVTRAETFGVVQVEAMACGKPVISTDLPSGVPWVNGHGESGLVVPPGDAGALRSAIRALATDAALRARLGAGARARVDREFDATRMAQRTVALYREVLDRLERAA